MRSILLSSILCAAFAFSGCAVAPSDGGSDQTVSAESASARARLVGSYTREVSKGNGEFYETLALVADGSYSATLPSKGGSILETGSFQVSSKKGLLSLTLDSDAGSSAKYSVSLAGDGSGMKLGSADSGTFVSERFLKDVTTTTCATDADCGSDSVCKFVSLCPPAAPGGVTCFAGRNECVKVAGVGASCGFRVPSPTIQCASGLECVHSGGPLDSLSCEKVGAVGDSCGFRTQSSPCASGLECVHFGGPLDSLSCEKVGAVGDSCGFRTQSSPCASGLECVHFGGPLGSLSCEKVGAVGDSCGFRTQSSPCASGLACVHVSGPLDALQCATKI
jgi:hypothetical protein